MKTPTIDDILAAAAAHYGVEVLDLRSRRRAHSRPRHVAMYLAKRLTELSFPAIGRAIGGRDHTGIMWGFRRIKDLLVTDPELDAAVLAIQYSLLSSLYARSASIQPMPPSQQVAPC